MSKREHQNNVIQAVVDRYSHGSGLDYSITHWPDEEERNSRACDAYAAARGGRPLAVEHTLIQSYDRQKQHDAEFMRVIGDLEAELRGAFAFRLRLNIPMFAVEKGQRWDEIKRALKTWLLSNPTQSGRTEPTIPGVPFRVTLFREDDASPGFTVGRWSDNTLNVSAGLKENIAAALMSKNDQLRAYREAGDYPILVLESDDVALVNRVEIYRAFLTAERAAYTSNIDQVWLASTITQENYVEVYCMKASQEFIDAVNPPNVLFGPNHRELWVDPVAT